MNAVEFISYLAGSLLLVYFSAYVWGRGAKAISDLGRI